MSNNDDDSYRTDPRFQSAHVPGWTGRPPIKAPIPPVTILAFQYVRLPEAGSHESTCGRCDKTLEGALPYAVFIRWSTGKSAWYLACIDCRHAVEQQALRDNPDSAQQPLESLLVLGFKWEKQGL